MKTAMCTRRHLIQMVGVGVATGGFSLRTHATQVVEVTIQGYQFTPQHIQVRVGDTVRWHNREKRTSHSVLFTGLKGFESERLFPGESWDYTFVRAGVYPYTCGPHPEMTGTVTVSE